LVMGSGSTFGNPAANFYRIPYETDPKEPEKPFNNLAETTAQLFFGVRMQCAKCHNHPFERWTQNDYYSLGAFFTRVKLRKDTLEGGGPDPKKAGAEVVYTERKADYKWTVTPPTGGTRTVVPKFLNGATPAIPASQDAREVLASWLASAD